MPELLLFDPEDNPSGPTLEAVLDQLIDEVRAKQARARAIGNTAGARESALVVTNLEQALLWQYRRGQITGVVEVNVKQPKVDTDQLVDAGASPFRTPQGSQGY